MLMSKEDYLKSVKKLRPKVYVNGERVKDITKHPVTRCVVEAMAKIYEMAQDPRYEAVMTAHSPFINEKISRCLHIF